MKKKVYFTGLACAIFGLFGCNQSERSATGPTVGAPMGSAMVRLPALPKDYLAKTGAGTQALFVLSVSGEGMHPIRKSWTLYPGHLDSVVIAGIPSGISRNFTGQLFQLDSTGMDSTLTHEGIDSAYIEGNKTADIHLFIHKKNAGSAHVCITIEEWSSDTTCINSHPTLPIPSNVVGCWKFSVTRKGVAPNFDSVFTGKLIIRKWDSILTGSVTWKSGARDSATGYVLSNGSHRVVFGSTPPYRQFSFDAILNSTGSSLCGVFSSPLRNIKGNFVATHTTCDTLIVPIPRPIPSDTIKKCYIVSQTFTPGKSATGRLALVLNGNKYSSAIFRWNGYPDMKVNGGIWTTPQAVRDSGLVIVRGIPPRGLTGSSDTTLDSLEYAATIMSRFPTFNGSIYKRTSETPEPVVGTWEGTVSVCTEKDLLH